MMRIIALLCILLTSYSNGNILPSKLKCVDKLCLRNVSTGRIQRQTSLLYGDIYELKKLSKVNIKGKNFDSSNTLWLIEFDGQKGFVDLSLLKEISNTVLNDLEVVDNPYYKPSSEGVTDETEENDSDSGEQMKMFTLSQGNDKIIPSSDDDETESSELALTKGNADQVTDKTEITQDSFEKKLFLKNASDPMKNPESILKSVNVTMKQENESLVEKEEQSNSSIGSEKSKVSSINASETIQKHQTNTESQSESSNNHSQNDGHVKQERDPIGSNLVSGNESANSSPSDLKTVQEPQPSGVMGAKKKVLSQIIKEPPFVSDLEDSAKNVHSSKESQIELTVKPDSLPETSKAPESQVNNSATSIENFKTLNFKKEDLREDLVSKNSLVSLQSEINVKNGESTQKSSLDSEMTTHEASNVQTNQSSINTTSETPEDLVSLKEPSAVNKILKTEKIEDLNTLQGDSDEKRPDLEQSRKKESLQNSDSKVEEITDLKKDAASLGGGNPSLDKPFKEIKSNNDPSIGINNMANNVQIEKMRKDLAAKDSLPPQKSETNTESNNSVKESESSKESSLDSSASLSGSNPSLENPFKEIRSNKDLSFGIDNMANDAQMEEIRKDLASKDFIPSHQSEINAESNKSVKESESSKESSKESSLDLEKNNVQNEDSSIIAASKTPEPLEHMKEPSAINKSIETEKESTSIPPKLDSHVSEVKESKKDATSIDDVSLSVNEPQREISNNRNAGNKDALPINQSQNENNGQQDAASQKESEKKESKIEENAKSKGSEIKVGIDEKSVMKDNETIKDGPSHINISKEMGKSEKEVLQTPQISQKSEAKVDEVNESISIGGGSLRVDGSVKATSKNDIDEDSLTINQSQNVSKTQHDAASQKETEEKESKSEENAKRNESQIAADVDDKSVIKDSKTIKDKIKYTKESSEEDRKTDEAKSIEGSKIIETEKEKRQEALRANQNPQQRPFAADYAGPTKETFPEAKKSADESSKKESSGRRKEDNFIGAKLEKIPMKELPDNEAGGRESVRSPLLKLLLFLERKASPLVDFLVRKGGLDRAAPLSRFLEEHADISLESVLLLASVLVSLLVAAYTPRVLGLSKDWRRESDRHVQLALELETRLAVTEKTRESLAAQNHSFEEAIEEYKGRVAEIQEDALRGRAAILADLERMATAHEGKLASLRRRLEESEERTRDLEGQLAACEGALRESAGDRAKGERAVEERDALAGQERLLAERLEAAEESLARLRGCATFVAMFGDLEEAAVAAKADLCLEAGQWRAEAEQARGEAVAAREALARIREEVAAAQQQARASEMLAEEHERERLRAVREQEAAELKLQVLSDYFRDKELDLQRSLGQEAVERVACQERAEALGTRVRALEAEKEALGSTAERLTAEVKEAHGFLAQVKADMGGQVAGACMRISGLERDLFAEREEVKKLRNRLSSFVGPTPPRGQNPRERPPSRQSEAGVPPPPIFPLSMLPQMGSPRQPFSGRVSANSLSKKSNHS